MSTEKTNHAGFEGRTQNCEGTVSQREDEPRADLIATHAGPSPDSVLLEQVSAGCIRAYRGLNGGDSPTWGARSELAVADLLRSNPGISLEHWLKAIISLARDLKGRGRHRSQPMTWIHRIPDFLPASEPADANASGSKGSSTETPQPTGHQPVARIGRPEEP